MACYWYNMGANTCADVGICEASEMSGFGNATIVPSTSEPPNSGGQMFIGFIAAAVAVVMFGTNFVPVKKFDAGDGVFFQFIMSIAIFLTGVIVNAVRGFPKMFPLAMLSGFLYSTGNMTVVPIIQCIGLGLGLLLWNSTNLIIGWASGKWGWFGINPQTPTDIPMNYAGVVLAFLSAVIFVLIKPEVSSVVLVESGRSNVNYSLSTQENQPYSNRPQPAVSMSPVERLSPVQKRVLGVVMAISTGLMYGLVFTPIIYIQDHPELYPGATKSGMDYLFTFYLGLFVTSLTYMMLYCIVTKNRPWVNSALVFPSMISGVMSGVGEASFLLAIQYLSESVSFPIIASGPGILGSILSVVIFKEIQGRKNILLLLLAFVIAVSGAVLSGLSKS